MRWVAIFQDAPGMASIRGDKGALQLAYLREHSEEILLAGALREAHQGPIVGGLWVMEVRTRERALELVEHDPYYLPGYRTYRLLTWAKALEDREAKL